MPAGELSDAVVLSDRGAQANLGQAVISKDIVSAWIDFAYVIGSQLLVYGWVVGFAWSVERTSITIGGVVVDLTSEAVPLHRPDVAQHFSLPQENDQHGFYALVDLPLSCGIVSVLQLSVTFLSGETGETDWPVSCFESSVDLQLGQHRATVRTLLTQLTKRHARRLIEFMGPALSLRMSVEEYLPSLPPPIRFEVDLCCILENRLFLVAGWFVDPAKEVSLAEVHVGGSVFSLLNERVSFARPDIAPALSYDRKPAQTLAGFVFAKAIPCEDALVEEATFEFLAGSAVVSVTRPVIRALHEARREFLLLVSKTDSEAAIVLIQHVARILESIPETRSCCKLMDLSLQASIARLSPSIQHVNPRFSLYIDRAIPVAEQGLFLTGWFDADPAASVRITFHCESSSFVISDNWSRHVRPDVTMHLANLGIQASSQEPGFRCYIPRGLSNAPCHLSARLGSGETRRMRLAVEENPRSVLQAVYTLLSTFDPTHPDLGSLLAQHVGPAVQETWALRPIASPRPVVRTYGESPANPQLSIIVPLFGRYDFAEYQLALFADDPEFQRLELIYIVDDPSISAPFAKVCPDLLGMYQVPFVVVNPGANLGFAGANNLGAGIARGPYLLFMNSDVLPIRRGWAGDLVERYQSLEEPGLLGVKLLYEDGSLQHAGMAFRKYAGWGDLWINDHPGKGQSPLGVNGIREVDAVTAACVLIQADLYRKLGGFCEDYITGDFEDSDLCLRAGAAARRNYVDLDVALYHLERQSQKRAGDAHLRTSLTIYNCWLHNQRWAGVIEQRQREPIKPRLAASGASQNTVVRSEGIEK